MVINRGLLFGQLVNKAARRVPILVLGFDNQKIDFAGNTLKTGTERRAIAGLRRQTAGRRSVNAEFGLTGSWQPLMSPRKISAHWGCAKSVKHFRISSDLLVVGG